MSPAFHFNLKALLLRLLYWLLQELLDEFGPTFPPEDTDGA